MKILVASSVHIWNDNRIFHKEIKSLSNKYKVEIHAVASFKYKTVNGVEIVGLKSYRKKIYRLINWFRLFFRILKSDCCVVHFHDFELLFICSILKIITNKVFIYDCHEEFSKVALTREWIPKIMKKSLSVFVEKIEPSLAVMMDYVIVANEPSVKNFNQKAILIRNYPILYEFGNAFNYKTQGRIKRILYVGNVTVERGIWQMLESVNLLSKKRQDFRFDIIGRIDPVKLVDEIKNYIIIKRLEKFTILHEHLDFQEVKQYLISADVGFCLFSPNERRPTLIPTKIFDYMCFGIPAISDKLPQLDQLFNNVNYSLAWDRTTESSCTNLLHRLLDDFALRKRYAENGIKLVINKYNWSTEETKLLQLYADIEELI